jgi:hypothetical protein
MKLRSLLLTALTGAVIIGKPIQAASISWSNQVFDTLYDSNGAALDSTFQFEIGTFINGFIPTGDNVADWSTNWTIFDAATLNTDELFVGSGPLNFFTSTATHQTDSQSSSLFTTPGSTFAQNTQAFLWVYDSKTVSFTSEWALVTDLVSTGNTADAWRFPSPTNDTGFLTWSLADAENAVFGKVQNGSSVGAGEFTVQPATFSLQTHQVPEPGGALLIASAGLLFMLRRARFLSQNR